MNLHSNDVGVLALRQADSYIQSAGPKNRRLPVNRTWTLALVLSDLFSCIIATIIAAYLLQAAGVPPPTSDFMMRLLATTFFLTGGVLFYLLRRGHYRHRHPFWTQAGHVWFASLLAVCVCLFTEIVHKDVRAECLIGWFLLPPVLLTMRYFVRTALERLGLWCIRVLILGDPGTGARAQVAIESEPAVGYEVAGIVGLRSETVRGGNLSWRDVLADHEAELLLVATEEPDLVFNSGLIEAVLRERVPLAVMPLLSGIPVHGCEQLNFFRHDVMLLKFRNNLADPLAVFVKRTVDLCLTILLLILVAPIMAIMIVLVKRDGGPAFFSHPRIGAEGRPFQCLKLRTMVMDAGAVLQRTLADDPEAAEEWAKTRKLARDPRITRIGRFLRRTSLDEVPQLLNVLRGEMSLVGPRPIVREEVPLYGRNISYYFEAQPGMTGLWQVSGRSDTSYSRRVELDVWYVKNWTVWNDLAILCMTVSAVFRRSGAR